MSFINLNYTGQSANSSLRPSTPSAAIKPTDQPRRIPRAAKLSRSGHLRSVANVLAEIINEAMMDDGSGIPKPLGTLLDANITEETYERLMRQKEYVKQAIEAKEARAASTGQPRLNGLALEIVKGLIDGIEIWAADGGLHPAIQEAYQRAKRSIGE